MAKTTPGFVINHGFDRSTQTVSGRPPFDEGQVVPALPIDCGRNPELCEPPPGGGGGGVPSCQSQCDANFAVCMATLGVLVPIFGAIGCAVERGNCLARCPTPTITVTPVGVRSWP